MAPIYTAWQTEPIHTCRLSHLKERIHVLFFSENSCILEILVVRLTANLGVRRHWLDVNVRPGPSISKSNFNQMPVESYC